MVTIYNKAQPTDGTSQTSMSPNALKELKTVLRIFTASFFLTPMLVWFVVTELMHRGYTFLSMDYFEIYRDMLSLHEDVISAWLIILAPIILYELVLTCCYYCKHPDRLRSVFEFPRARSHDKSGHPHDGKEVN